MAESTQAGEDEQDQEPEMLTLAWRRQRVQLGDMALHEAQTCFYDPRVKDTEAMYWVARAQAYFAAANVRVSEPRPKGFVVDTWRVGDPPKDPYVEY